MARKLRLLVTKQCPRNCAGCCNKDFDIDNLPAALSTENYDEILITGGEPMLFPGRLIEFLTLLRETSDGKIYLYTASLDIFRYYHAIIPLVDGIQLTLHNISASEASIFNSNQQGLRKYASGKSFRLVVMPECNQTISITPGVWSSIRFIDWIKNCPLPEGEEIKRLNTYWE